jgi:DNA excision repair protein ERCC-2
MSIAKLQWPVTPRPGQREAAEELAMLIEQGHSVLFSAPVGWGKTHAVIAALIQARALPALWLVRSLALGPRVAEDAALWGLVSFVAAGREKTCLLWGSLGDAAHDYCRNFRYKCPFAKLPREPPPSTDWTALVAKGREGGWCPYFAQDFIESDIFIQNYNRRARRYVRAVVVDEAHNLSLPEERTLQISRIAEAISAARERGGSQRLLNALERMMRAVLVYSERALDSRTFLNEEEISELLSLYYRSLEEGDARLKPLIEIVRAPAAYVEGEKILIFKPPRVPPFKPAVFVTATPLSPIPFEVDAEVKIPWETKLKTIILDSLTSKFDEFDSKMALNYKKLLINLAKKFRRILVFAASERVARELRNWVNYEEVIPPPDWEGVLMLRARGRFAEGVNVPAECVVMAGAPYLPPEVTDRLARVYRALGFKDPLRCAIDLPMLTVTLQCVGRAWRDPAKPPFVVLADSRYGKYRDELASYFEIAETGESLT